MTIAHGTVAEKLQTATQAARRGDKSLARDLLLEVTRQAPSQEEAWLWLAGVAETLQEARSYLQTALALNPQNQQTQKGLHWVKQQLAAQDDGSQPCPRCGKPVPAGMERCPHCGYVEGRVEQEEAASPEAAVAPAPTLEGISPDVVLSVEQAEEIDACLDRIAYESEARCIILANVSGQLISERGETLHMNTQVLSAVAAGELAATRELARLVGEKARFKMLLHEGERNSVYLSDVGEQLILVIVFDVEAMIGLVRVLLKQAVEELQPILDQMSQTNGRERMHETLDSDFAQLLESELDSSLEASDLW